MEIVNLEQNHKCFYDELMMDNFSVQLSDKNTFGRLEADKIIETAINKDTKTPDGTTGTTLYSRYGITYRYMILHTCIECIMCLSLHL